MKKIVLLTLMLLLTACNENDSTTTETPEPKAVTPKTEAVDIKAKEQDVLRELGFVINGDKITIDMNQTAEFIKKMEREMQEKSDEIERKIEKQDINFTRDFGFDIDETHISLDLNKTRDMLQQINILMKDILLEGNTTSH